MQKMYVVCLTCRYDFRRAGAWSSSLRSQTSKAVKGCAHPFIMTGSTQLKEASDIQEAAGSYDQLTTKRQYSSRLVAVSRD